jgi:hypothetical protein
MHHHKWEVQQASTICNDLLITYVEKIIINQYILQAGLKSQKSCSEKKIIAEFELTCSIGISTSISLQKRPTPV